MTRRADAEADNGIEATRAELSQPLTVSTDHIEKPADKSMQTLHHDCYKNPT